MSQISHSSLPYTHTAVYVRCQITSTNVQRNQDVYIYSSAVRGVGHIVSEASEEYRMRQCWCCQIAGIWIEFHPFGGADGARQTSNTTLIRTRGAVLALTLCIHFMHACQKASFNNMYLRKKSASTLLCGRGRESFIYCKSERWLINICFFLFLLTSRRSFSSEYVI